jgi:hypothetical protein
LPGDGRRRVRPLEPRFSDKAKPRMTIDAELPPREKQASAPLAAAIVLPDGLPQDVPIVLEGEHTEDEEGSADGPLNDAPPGGVDDDPMPWPLRDAQADGRSL